MAKSNTTAVALAKVDVPAIGRNAPRRAAGNASAPPLAVRRGLAKALIELRASENMSIADLAARIAVNPGRLDLIERGVARSFTRKDIDAILRALDLVDGRNPNAVVWQGDRKAP